jgi:prolyl-tRNA editing enzyme YbaK/EbsC (Cys-tRNA(Pro) deacylase)
MSDAREQRVRDAIRALGEPADMLVVAEGTHTAEMAAAAAGCELGQIVKTLVAYVAGTPMLVLVSGDRRLDDRLLADRFGVGRKQVKLASAEQVLALTGFPVGGVSPFGLPQPLGVLIDESFGRFETVWIAGGTPSAILPVGLSALVRHTKGVVTAVAR